MTQKQKERSAREHYRAYLMSEMTSLSKAYGRWSARKERAFEHCQALCKEADGYGLKIITRNSDVFTAGFESVNDLGVVMFTYISPSFHVTVEVTPDMIKEG